MVKLVDDIWSSLWPINFEAVIGKYVLTYVNLVVGVTVSVGLYFNYLITFYTYVLYITRATGSVTRFLKFLAAIFLAKEAQMIGNFLGNFEKINSYVKPALATFWAALWKIWANSLSGHTARWCKFVKVSIAQDERDKFLVSLIKVWRVTKV